jgi:hypothetical protein
MPSKKTPVVQMSTGSVHFLKPKRIKLPSPQTVEAHFKAYIKIIDVLARLLVAGAVYWHINQTLFQWSALFLGLTALLELLYLMFKAYSRG